MRSKSILLCTLVALLASACASSSGNLADDSYKQEDGILHHEQMVLGNKLEDPYEVSNITKALASLYPTKADRVQVSATDKYVRFLPEDQDELALLTGELGLELIDHPLDYQILRDGDYYHDPAVEDDKITWLYAVVPVDFEAPAGVVFEELHDCYFSENDSSTKAMDPEIDWDAVERESFVLTGNADMLSEPTKGQSGIPSGRITIKDEDYDSAPVGVVGVKVCCNVFVKIATAYTDENGSYTMKKTFNSSPRYSLVFTNVKGFNLGFNLVLLPASVSTMGKHNPMGCNFLVTQEGDPAMFRRCAVNNAGYEYYSNCRNPLTSIKTPPANLRIWMFSLLSGSITPMFHQGVFMNSDIVTSILGEYTTVVKLFLPDVILGLGGKQSYSQIYRAAIHELAHVSHYLQVGNDYWETLLYYMFSSWISTGGLSYGVGTELNHGYCEIAQMWAYFMENAFVKDRYPDSYTFAGTSYWFFPQIFTYLDERGLDRYRIFQALASDIADRDALRARLVSLYPEFKTSINDAFVRYY